MAVSLVQSQSATGSTGDTQSVTLASAATAGQLIFVSIAIHDNATPTTPTGFTFLSGASAGKGNNRGCAIFYKVASGGEQVISNATSGSVWSMVASVYSGVDVTTPVNVYGSTVTDASTVHTSPSVTPTGSGERLLVFSAYVKGGSSTANWTNTQIGGNTTGVNERADFVTASITGSTLLADKIVSSTSGSYFGTSTNTLSGTGMASIAIFNAAVGGGGGTTGQIKVRTSGGAWAAKPVKVWNGSAWVTKPLKRWNGSAWVTTNY